MSERVDVIVRIEPDSKSHSLTVLELTDDGVVVAGFRKHFARPIRARQIGRDCVGYRTWDRLTPEELVEVRRICDPAKPVGREDQ